MRPPLKQFLLLVLLALAGCEETPTGRSQLALLPDAMMTDMGERAFAQMKRSQPLASAEGPKQLVRCVAEKVIAAAERQYPQAERPQSWEVQLFDDPTPNAFALPGGHIGVHTGLLDVAETPAQLAAILGHEVGHVLAEHGNERMTHQLGIKIALVLLGLLGDIEQAELLRALGLGAHLGISLPFSRAHESEADRMGLVLMAAAGFDPQQSVTLWRNMAAASDGQPLEFLSTHPAHDTRIRELQRHVPQVRQLYETAAAADCEG